MNKNQMLRYPIFLFLFSLQLLATNAFAAQKVLDASQLDQTPVFLTHYFAVLEDPSAILTLAEVQQPEVAARFQTDSPDAEALNYGYSRSAYWLRLVLRNDTNRPIDRMLEIGYPRLSSVQFHRPMADGTYESLATGMAMPFATRPYPNRFFVLPMTLPAHSDQVYYLRFQSSDPILVPARLWAPEAFHTYVRNDYVVQAWYFGIASAMVIFNLLIFIALRDVSYLLYVNFVIWAALTLAAHGGLAQEFLWPGATQWADSSHYVTTAVSLAALLLFMRRMLDTGKVIPKLDPLLKILVGLCLLTAMAVAISLQTFAKAAILFDVSAGVAVLGVGLLCAFKRQRSAYVFVAAYVTLLVGGVIFTLRALGLLPTNVFTANALQFGSTVEMLLLAFALADRFNVIRQENAKAQRLALEAQRHLVENLRSSEQLLEARVAQRTDELQVLNLKLAALSSTDGLTGIANRRRFDEVLASEWLRAARAGQPLAVGLLDVDWFKKYNDHYGHQAGDECLRRVAEVFTAKVRRTGDLVARYGGEEFVFIAPGTNGNNALGIARKICEALQALGLPHEMSEFGIVTASIGVAARVPREGESPDVLIKAADDALYRAKAQGRNQAVNA
jgi:diguanylate cyclase (GGDEF)-like protein